MYAIEQHPTAHFIFCNVYFLSNLHKFIYLWSYISYMFRGVRKEYATSGERAEIVRHKDNLYPEGQFEIPETQVVIHGTQVAITETQEAKTHI